MSTKEHLDRAMQELSAAYEECLPVGKIQDLVSQFGERFDRKQNDYPFAIKTSCNEASVKAFFYTTGRLPRLERQYHEDDEIGDYESIDVSDDLDKNQAIEFTIRSYMSRFDPSLSKQLRL